MAHVAPIPAVFRMISRPYSLGESAKVHVEDVPVVLLDALFEVRDVVGVEQSRIVDDDAAFVEFIQVLRQGLYLFVAVVGFFLWVPREGVSEREEEVVPVAPRLDFVVSPREFPCTCGRREYATDSVGA